MLFFKNGYLNLIVKHSNGLSGTLALDGKFNNGRKHHVDINMEYDPSELLQRYTLFVKNDTFENQKNTTNTLNKKNVFKIKQAFHYIGGVPPVFNKTCLPFNTTSFLGFLKLNVPLTNKILSYGTTKTNKQVSDKKICWTISYILGFYIIVARTDTFRTLSFIKLNSTKTDT